jgi:hypothetical protein
MVSFNEYLNESEKYICRCLRGHLTESLYKEQRLKYPDISKEEFFLKIKDYISEKAGIYRCKDHCGNVKNTNKYEIYYKDLD